MYVGNHAMNKNYMCIKYVSEKNAAHSLMQGTYPWYLQGLSNWVQNSNWFSGIPSIDGFHVHYIPDTCPVNAQSTDIWLINNSIPVIGVCNHFLFVVHPIRIGFEPRRPFLRPLCPMLFNSRWNGVQTSLHGNIPIQRTLKIYQLMNEINLIRNKSHHVMNSSS